MNDDIKRSILVQGTEIERIARNVSRSAVDWHGFRFVNSVLAETTHRLKDVRLPGRSIPANSHDILVRAQTHYANAVAHEDASLPSFGNRWGELKKRMAERIASYSRVEQALDYAQTESWFDHRLPISAKELSEIYVAQHTMKYVYPEFASAIDQIRETFLSYPGTAVILENDVPVSNIHYFHMLYLLSCLRFDRSIARVCEIGGGYGNLARLWLDNPINPATRYCIVDLPESLFYAEIFLGLIYPSEAIFHVSDPQFSMDRYLSTPRAILFCPIDQRAITKEIEFDLITNAGSMAEMSDAWVDLWANWFDEQTAKYIYSHNYFGNAIDRIFEGRNIFAPRVSANWTVAMARGLHPMMILQSTARNTAELIFRRAKKETAVSASSLFKAFSAVKLTHENFVHLAHVLRTSGDPQLLSEFIVKSAADLGYSPVELLHLGEIALRSKTEWTGREELVALVAKLLKRFEDNYPEGVLPESVALLKRLGIRAT